MTRRRKWPATVRPVRAVSSAVQVRLATRSTGEDYVTEKQWLRATLRACPWHPEGGCGFCRHGTYPRVRPRGTYIARWYCPTVRRTVSALPDALASHFSGTLAELEAHVLAVELSASLAAAASTRRLEVELPGALRYLSRICKAVHKTLNICRGLLPERLASVPPTVTNFVQALDEHNVLIALRPLIRQHLPQLPTPVGFNPSRHNPVARPGGLQHQTGRDPPCALLDPAINPIADR
ncbi:MAG: hypothetical protein AB8B63_24470 [Granulosicoccus sp.]